MQPQVVWENGRVALAKDLMFGLCVMTETGWYPVNMLDLEDVQLVFDLVDFAPGCIYLQDLIQIRDEKRQEVA